MDPVVSGTPDLSYLREALARAGVRLHATELGTDTLTDGRTGASVVRLRTDVGRSFVLKIVPPKQWRQALGLDGSEARLWLAGATRSLPAGLRCPTLDVARNGASWWILMEDVSPGILPRGAFDEDKACALMRGIAKMHARYWEHPELDALPVEGFEVSANAMAAASACLGRQQQPSDAWLEQLIEDVWVARAILPVFLDALSSNDADFYVQLCGDHARIARALGQYPRTLIHGDLRRANIAYDNEDVVAFDWELAAAAPGARDLEWYSFLQFWAYPPDARPPTDRPELYEVYLETLERERGTRIDRTQFDESCDVAWLSVLCQLGFCLADPLTEASPSPEAVARSRRNIGQAIDRARRIRDRL